MHGKTGVPTLEEFAMVHDSEGMDTARSRAVSVALLSADAPAAECQALLLDNLEFVERTVGVIGRRHALSSWEVDDLTGQVKLRLIADDYAVLRKFRGRSRLTTYLTTVIQNLFRDYRIQKWGKWRPSAAAKRCGDVGVQLEALLYRDNFNLTEAIEHLRSRFGVKAPDAELLEIAARLRARTTRRFESDAVLSRLQAPERADQRVIDGERGEAQGRIVEALTRALAGLGPEDRLILRMRFVERLTIRSIASTLDLDQRRIYSRVRRILRRVREGMVAEGVEAEEVLDLLDWPACAFEAGLADDVRRLSRPA